VQNARTEAPLTKAMAAGITDAQASTSIAKNVPRAETLGRPTNGSGGSSNHKNTAQTNDSAALLDAQNQIKIQSPAFEDMAGPKVLSLQERQALNEHGIATCNACGFPVSDGRALCLDCETNTPAADLPDALRSPDFGEFTPAAPADLTFGMDAEAQASGFKHWITCNKYLLGIVAVIGSAILLLLLR
jgi:hypothetical protein